MAFGEEEEEEGEEEEHEGVVAVEEEEHVVVAAVQEEEEASLFCRTKSIVHSFFQAAQFNAQSSVSRTPRLSNSAWHSTRVGHSSTCLRGIANTSSFVNHPFLRICTTAGRMNSNSSAPAPPPIADEVGAEVPVPW